MHRMIISKLSCDYIFQYLDVPEGNLVEEWITISILILPQILYTLLLVIMVHLFVYLPINGYVVQYHTCCHDRSYNLIVLSFAGPSKLQIELEEH
jgi:hypothetical protein